MKKTTQKPQKKLPCPHCDKSFANLSGLASHLHFLHPDVPAKGRPGKQPSPPAKSAQPALSAGASITGDQAQGKAKKLTCAYCGKVFLRPSALSTHTRYLHPGKSRAAVTLPKTT